MNTFFRRYILPTATGVLIAGLIFIGIFLLIGYFNSGIWSFDAAIARTPWLGITVGSFAATAYGKK